MWSNGRGSSSKLHGIRKLLSKRSLPEFETDEAHDYFITRLFILPGFYDYHGENDTDKVTDKVPDRVPDRAPDRVTDKLNEKELTLLSLLHDDPWQTKPHLAEKIGVSRKTITVYLKNLKDRQIISRIGSDRKGYWQINREPLNSSDFPEKEDNK